MKIALGMRDFYSAKGGAERSITELMVFLARKGHEVHIFAHQFDSLDDSIFLHRIPLIPFPKSLKVLSFAFLCLFKMKQIKVDVVVGVGNTLRADLLQPRGGVHWSWFWRSLRAYDNPWVRRLKFLGRILSPKQWAEGIVEDAPYKKARKIVAISEMVKKDIIDHYRIPEERIAIIYTGIDIKRFHPNKRQFREVVRGRHGISPEEFVVLFAAHNFRLKGLKYLIRAMALVKRVKERIRLLVIGRDRAGPYRRLARTLGCEKEVLFVGGVKEPELYYSAANILVHPTFYDACSRVVLEALASGLPVITTRFNGAGWIITEGEEGFVLDDPRDVTILTEKILILSDPDKLKVASLAARKLAQRYSQQKCYREMLNMLNELR